MNGMEKGQLRVKSKRDSFIPRDSIFGQPMRRSYRKTVFSRWRPESLESNARGPDVDRDATRLPREFVQWCSIEKIQKYFSREEKTLFETFLRRTRRILRTTYHYCILYRALHLTVRLVHNRNTF